MIRRAPLPQRDFAIFSNSLIRDKRLSFRTRGLLMLMLSYPPEWKFDREWLAGQSEQDGVTAVRSSLRELEQYGYLVRRRVHVGGRFSWDRILYDEPREVPDATTEGDGTDTDTTGGRATGCPTAAVDPPSKEVLERSTEQEDVMECLPRSQARSGAEKDGLGLADERHRVDHKSWRNQDRQLFQDLTGDAFQSEGPPGRWGEGAWSTERVYDAFRKERGHRWPGRRLQAIADDGGLDDWLLDEGLEVVTAERLETARRCRCRAVLVSEESKGSGDCVRCRAESERDAA